MMSISKKFRLIYATLKGYEDCGQGLTKSDLIFLCGTYEISIVWHVDANFNENF